MSSTFTYMPYHKTRKDLRRGLCTGCGNKYLIIKNGACGVFLRARRIRVVDTWYSYWFKDSIGTAGSNIGSPFRSPCCEYPMARTRINVGDVFRVIE